MILRTLNSGNYGIFLTKGNAGFISSTVGSLFLAPNIVRHPYNKGPKRDPNLENYPCAKIGIPFKYQARELRSHVHDRTQAAQYPLTKEYTP